MIKLTKKDTDFEGISFCVRAEAIEHYMSSLNYVYVNNNKMEATDGHRLHEYELQDTYADGFYLVVKKTKSELILDKSDTSFKWPNTKAVWPTDYKTFPEVIGKFDTSEELCSAYSNLIRTMPANVTLNHKYVSDLGGEFTAYSHPEGRLPVVFINADKRALIMPRRI